ncbi:hypothetical protein [Lewinella cohaerens]|uniref:hypothetical protein n=1 Tax=Lewinella cohaerens TaxID=70995 RepID=UPI00037BD2AB|nr:hypothetical protein [Lewinella cohaerens]
MAATFFKILWIDDEHEKLGGTIGRFKRNNIQLVPYKSLNSGMSELERNYSDYDGVLLDAKFFRYDDDTPGTEDTDVVFRAKERLLQLPKKFEIFVLTGQAEAYADDTFHKSFPKVYEKGKDNDIEELIQDITKAAAESTDTQLRQLHHRVFEVCTEQYIGQQSASDLLALIKAADASDTKHYVTAIRKIIEDLFRAFNRHGLLPDEFVIPKITINPSGKFLTDKGYTLPHSGRKYRFNHHESTRLPQIITRCLWSVLDITQAGSHRSPVDQHFDEVKTPYLFQSTLFQLMEIIAWFKIYIDGGPKKNNWDKIER